MPGMDVASSLDDEKTSYTKQLILRGPDSIREADYPQKAELVKEFPVPEGGCTKKVFDRVPTTPINTVDLDIQLRELVFLHPDFIKAQTNWAACMKTAGHDFKQVNDAADSTVFDVLDAETVALATHDVACTEQSRWPDYFYAILADYQRQAIEKDPTLFESSLRSLQQFAEEVRAL